MRIREYIAPLTVVGLFFCGLIALGAVSMNYGRTKEMRQLTVTITSDTNGDSTQTISAMYVPSDSSGATPFAGKLYRFTTVPGSGSSSPTANWDVTVVDGDAADILQGQGANRSQSTTQSIILANPTAIVGAHELRANNMGGTRTATLRLFFGP